MCLFDKERLEKVRLENGVTLGYEYEIVKNRGHRCGYIRVEPGHPWFGKHYDNLDVSVHGGLTYSEAGTACPTHGEEAEWWVGFDCAHSGDATDLNLLSVEELKREIDFARQMGRPDEIGLFPAGRYGATIKDTLYVRRQCESLAIQAAEAARANE